MSFDIVIPDVSLKVRIPTDQSPGFTWADFNTVKEFANKRVVIFGVPGAFTPTCSSTHLPGFEMRYQEFKDAGIDEVYCLSVNDSFTMNSWFNQLEIKNVKPLPDGNAEFTRMMGFLVYKHNLGFGQRSWRYAMVVNNNEVEMMWVEPGLRDNANDDPFEVSDATTVLEWLRSV